MEEYYLKKTFNTPEIRFSPAEGVLSIAGRSIPEDPGEIYDVIIEKLTEYFYDPQPLTRIEIKLEYINSGSSKYMLEFMRILKANNDDGKKCLVQWFYEEDDESIYELGIHYRNTVQVPFELVEYY